MAGKRPKPDPAHVELARRLGQEVGRELSARTILFHDAFAARLGLNATESKCLDLAMRAEGPLTAGRLAELTGLTTGAITGVLDKLERTGYVRREKDERDRRQVLVRVHPERLSEARELMAPFEQAFVDLATSYTPEQLELIADFQRKAIAILEEHTRRIQPAYARSTPPKVEPPRAQGATPSELVAPLGDLREASLEFSRGVGHVVFEAGRDDELYRARFEGTPPSVSAVGGRVVFAYKRFSFAQILEWKKKVHVAMSPLPRWRVVLAGGATHVDARLTDLDVSELVIDGGVSDSQLAFGRPSGTVTVRVRYGASDVVIARPAGVPVRVSIVGGASKISIDTLKLGSAAGEIRWESPDYGAARDRIDISFTGGVSNFAVRATPA